jgi:chromosome segregation ATPase
MIESIMYFGIGFLFAALSVLIVVPLVHGRAVRLTTRRLEGAIPSSMTEIRAHKDLLRAEFAMTTRDLEAKIEQLKTEKANQLTELGKKGDAINRLKIDLGVLRDQLRAAEEKFEAKATALDDAEHALSDRESKLTTVLGELDERSALADAQKIEIIALKTQVEALKERLDLASNELQAVEDRRDADRIELKAATQKLMEERGKFENFHHRVAELVKQVVTQTTEDKILARRAQDDLENRLVEQSRLLNEREFELKHLREEIEIARKAESDLRVTIIEIDGRDKTATQNLEAEKAKLQAALDRANGERMRLAHELASLKRQGKEARAA